MAMSDHKAKDAAMASYMKDHPNSYPDSVRLKNGHAGNGVSLRVIARSMGHVPNNTSAWDIGMLGGIIVARLGYGDYGIPSNIYD